MSTTVKKSLAKIFLYFLLLLLVFYFSFYNQQSAQISQIYEYGNNGYTHKLIVTDFLNHDSDAFELFASLMDEYGGNMSIFVTEDNEIVEYVYITQPSYFDDVEISSGRFLTSEDNLTDAYVSSKNSDDPNQVGTIELFPCDREFTIKAVSADSLPESFFNRYIYLNLADENDYSSVSTALEALGFSITEDNTISSDYYFNFYLMLIPAFLIIICISLSLYEILNSYKKIAVKKLMGMTNLRIFAQWALNSIICMAAGALLSSVIGFLVWVRSFSAICLQFMAQTLIYDVAAILALLVAVSIPFIYVRKIRPSEMLRNKKPVVAVEVMNLVFKVFVGVVSVSLFATSISNYQTLTSFFQDRYSYWEDTKDYYTVSRFGSSAETVLTEDGELVEDKSEQIASYNAYAEYFVEHGAILAVFEDYTDERYSEGLENHDNIEYQAATASINPNYLEKFDIYDENGDVIRIEETEERHIVLVPVKYKELEDEVYDYFKWFISDDVYIIWTANGQNVFSYRIDVNSSNGNCVTDPILEVITTSNTSADDWWYLEASTGDQSIITKALSDNVNAEEEILDVYYQYYDEEVYSITLTNLYSSVASDVEQTRTLAVWALGICAAFVVLLVIIIAQCLFLYFEERRQSIAVMRLLGTNIFRRYMRLFEDVIISWAAIFLISFLFNTSATVALIAAGCFAAEMLGLIICIKTNETSRVVDTLKNK